ncbi:MAG: ribonuclease R [bacterium]
MKKTTEKEKEQFIETIKNVFLSEPKTRLNYKQVYKKTGIHSPELKKHTNGILNDLAREEFLLELYKGKYILHPKEKERKKSIGPLITGRVEMKQTGKAYIITDDLLEDVFIASNNTYKALNNDKVKVRLFPKRKNKKTEGEIIEIIERSKTHFVGTIKLHEKFAFFIPDNKSNVTDLYIPLDQLNNAKPGEKVIAEMTDWPDEALNPFGKITKILGKQGENNVEIHAILEEYNLPYTFKEEVTSEANKIDSHISNEEIKTRKDFREILTFTIDPDDAKDFDDALSYRIDNGQLKIGVHIADVSYYIKENSLLDNEAYNRATSVYLVDRVVPMLPEKLSNEICSLRPNEEKLCFSVEFTFDDKNKIINTWIGKTVIKSNRRFTYDEVQNIIDNKKGEFSEEILNINELAKSIRKKRLRSGALAFEKSEVKFKLDAKGKPLEVIFKEQNESHNLIEEFMLLANKTIAEKIGKKKSQQKSKTFVYRVHDIPNPEKLNNLSEFVSKLGYSINTETRSDISKSLNSLLKNSKGKGEENIIETLTIRSMAKAEYSTDNIGHYGLAFDYYTHFTSPIRRYPDLMVHRLLNSYLKNEKAAFDKEEYELKCKHSSDMEKRSQEAERDSIKYKQVEFLSDKTGKEFKGVISGVSKWGIFVEIIENKCEGMIRLKDMNKDYFYLDEDNYQVIGHNTNKKYKLGDTIDIRIKRADFQKREIDFELA